MTCHRHAIALCRNSRPAAHSDHHVRNSPDLRWLSESCTIVLRVSGENVASFHIREPDASIRAHRELGLCGAVEFPDAGFRYRADASVVAQTHAEQDSGSDEEWKKQHVSPE